MIAFVHASVDVLIVSQVDDIVVTNNPVLVDARIPGWKGEDETLTRVAVDDNPYALTCATDFFLVEHLLCAQIAVYSTIPTRAQRKG